MSWSRSWTAHCGAACRQQGRASRPRRRLGRRRPRHHGEQELRGCARQAGRLWTTLRPRRYCAPPAWPSPTPIHRPWPPSWAVRCWRQPRWLATRPSWTGPMRCGWGGPRPRASRCAARLSSATRRCWTRSSRRWTPFEAGDAAGFRNAGLDGGGGPPGRRRDDPTAIASRSCVLGRRAQHRSPGPRCNGIPCGSSEALADVWPNQAG